MRIVQNESSLASYIMDKLDKTASEPMTLTINRDLVKKDLGRLAAEKELSTNMFNIKNIQKLEKHLNKLLSATSDDNSKVELSWCKDNDSSIYKAYPFNFIYEPLYKINTCHYIEVGSNQKLVVLDLSSMADIIAFDYAYRDLGEDDNTIEDILKDCGMQYFEDIRILEDYFSEILGSQYRSMYELGKGIKAEDCIHLDKEGKELYDYFGKKRFKYIYNKTTYKDAIKYSCAYAAMCIAGNFSKNAISIGLDLRCVMIRPNMLAFMMERVPSYYEKGQVTISEIENNVLEEVGIRFFGRNFRIDTDIKIY